MSIGPIFAPVFCAFYYASFYQKRPRKKIASYMGVYIEAIPSGIERNR